MDMSARLELLFAVVAVSTILESVVPVKSEQINVVALVNKTITLKCDIPLSDPPAVSWVDRVNNDGYDPEPIYSVESGMVADHPNSEYLSVDSKDFSLTISMLQTTDLGEYICRSNVDGTVHERSYYVVVARMPTCRGENQLRVGNPTKLSCQVQYSSSVKLELEWMRNGVTVDSVDETEILMPKRSVSVDSVGPDDDKVVYKCQMKIADMVEHCSITLDVAYAVQDLTMTPNKPVIVVGEELNCSARGNPTPDITLGPPTVAQQAQSGPGWKSLIIQPGLLNTRQTVKCTASNTVDGVQTSPSVTVTFNVTEKASTQQSTAGGNTAVIAGIVVAIIILVVIIIVVCVIKKRRKSKKPPKEENGGSKPVPTKEEAAMDHRTNGQTTTA